MVHILQLLGPLPLKMMHPFGACAVWHIIPTAHNGGEQRCRRSQQLRALPTSIVSIKTYLCTQKHLGCVCCCDDLA